MNNLTDQELQELENKFKAINMMSINDSSSPIIHQFSNGKIIKGYISENNTLFISSVTNFLCE